MTDHDFRPAFDRLARIMGWDELDPGPPIAPTVAPPRALPPARDDVASVARFAAWRRALRGRG